MQNFTDIPSTRTLSDSLAEILNNDKTALSLSSGTAFPTTNLQLGMPCYRSDQQKLYILTQVSPSAVWKLWMDFTGSEGKAPNAEAVDGVDSSTIVQNTRQIIAGAGLSGGGDLSANRTLSLAAGAASANLGFTPVNKAGDTMTGNLLVAKSGTAELRAKGGDYGAVRLTSDAGRDFQIVSLPSSDPLNPSALSFEDIGAGFARRLIIDSSGRVRIPSQPSFACINLATGIQYPTQINTWLPFKSLLNNWQSPKYSFALNNGNCVSNDGTFTAPTTGIYVFSVGVTNNPNTGYSVAYLALFLNGVVIAPYQQCYNPSNGYHASSISYALFLAAGDTVDVGGYYGNTNIGIPGSGYIHFTGHLIA